MPTLDPLQDNILGKFSEARCVLQIDDRVGPYIKMPFRERIPGLKIFPFESPPLDFLAWHLPPIHRQYEPLLRSAPRLNPCTGSSDWGGVEALRNFLARDFCILG